MAVDISSVIFLDPSGDNILAADNNTGGLFLSMDAGRNWGKMKFSSHNDPIHHIVRDPADPLSIYMASSSEGIYRLRLPDNYSYSRTR
jgi:hypothetical protein